MPAPGPRTPRRLPETVRRRLEVASATAWEALVEAHTSHALQLIALLADRLPFDDAVARYLREMEVSETMAAAVRNRVLVALEDAERPDDTRPSLQLFATTGEAQEAPEESDADGASEGWRRFRPDVLMRGLKERHRRHDETEAWIRLAIARAEEGIISPTSTTRSPSPRCWSPTCRSSGPSRSTTARSASPGRAPRPCTSARWPGWPKRTSPPLSRPPGPPNRVRTTAREARPARGARRATRGLPG